MIRLTLDNKLTLQKLPWDLRDQVKRTLTIENPAYIEAERMGRWTGDLPGLLRFYEQQGTGTLIIPRGFVEHALQLIGNRDYQLDDQRLTLPKVDFRFTGILKPFQRDAVDDMVKRDFGTLSAPTGAGKTVMALAIIAERRQPALIVVHTKELLNQWVERITTFLDIPRSEIGKIGGGGKMKIGERTTVALIQSLYRIADEIKPHIGFLIVDECHRAPSRTFTEAVTTFDCRFMLGLSATPYRRDGLSRLIYWYLGDCHHTVDRGALVENGDILKAEVIRRETAFETWKNPIEEYQAVLSDLVSDPDRNGLIAADVVREASNGGGVCLVLSDRREHCQVLAALIQGQGGKADVLTGDMLAKARAAVVNEINSGTVRVVCATGQLIGEGFDEKSLQTLFLATPIKFSGRLTQYLGRILRPAPGKEAARVYDYIDSRCPVFEAQARARARVYAAA